MNGRGCAAQWRASHFQGERHATGIFRSGLQADAPAASASTARRAARNTPRPGFFCCCIGEGRKSDARIAYLETAIDAQETLDEPQPAALTLREREVSLAAQSDHPGAPVARPQQVPPPASPSHTTPRRPSSADRKSGERSDGLTPQTLKKADSLLPRILEILKDTTLKDHAKAEALLSLLASAKPVDSGLVRALCERVLRGAESEKSCVFFIAVLMQHHGSSVAASDLQLVTGLLRGQWGAWKDPVCYGQAFSHLYEGTRGRLDRASLRAELTALQQLSQSPLRDPAGFRRWAEDKLRDLIKSSKG